MSDSLFLAGSPFPDLPVLVLVTCLDASVAATIARTLVAEKLAACVTISSAQTSHYCWEGLQEAAPELQLTIKTMPAALQALHARLSALHPYDVPEFLVLPTIGTSVAYGQWIRANVLP